MTGSDDICSQGGKPGLQGPLPVYMGAESVFPPGIEAKKVGGTRVDVSAPHLLSDRNSAGRPAAPLVGCANTVLDARTAALMGETRPPFPPHVPALLLELPQAHLPVCWGPLCIGDWDPV